MKAFASIGLPAWLARLGLLRRGDGSEPSGAIPVRDWIHVSTAAPTRLIGFDQGLVCVVLALLALAQLALALLMLTGPHAPPGPGYGHMMWCVAPWAMGWKNPKPAECTAPGPPACIPA